MGSSFFGFNIATSGLFVSQRALNVTAHNIANANTPGFSRQRLEIESSRPDTLPASQGMLGTGVEPLPVVQIRDEFLDKKVRDETTTSGEWGVREDVLEMIESIFNEPSDSGITTVLDDYFASLQELSKGPENLTTRALVRQRGIALAENLRFTSESFREYQEQLDFDLETNITQVNSFAKEIADLNKQIYSSELDGSTANDLRDKRNYALDQLSEFVDINYYEDSEERFYVDVNGHSLVSHFNYDTLELEEREDLNHPEDAQGLHDIVWSDGSTFTIKSGKIAGLIDMRDGISDENKGLPYYMDKLNEFADTLVNEINRLHMTGYDLDGNTGTYFFTINNMSTADYESYLINEGLDGGSGLDVTTEVTDGVLSTNTEEENQEIIRSNISSLLANNPSYADKSVKYISTGQYLLVDRVSTSELTISEDIDLDLDKVAASSTEEGVPGDGINALAMAEVRNAYGLYDWGTPDEFIKSLISNLGVDGQEAQKKVDVQEAIINQLETERQSIMGVSLDEEMSEMIKFQHSYNANARMVTTLDEQLDTIINKLGLVGR